MVGAVVGDQFFQRGNPGLGVLIQVYASRLQGPQLYAAILVASLLGVAVFVIFGWLGTARRGPLVRLQLTPDPLIPGRGPPPTLPSLHRTVPHTLK